ncbi:membrane protein insertase YidC [Nocardioides sp. ChNu-153]|uniref:membrane protein insertase YidC n=1 Tax=unclassified Nocardioides TaxID=2615069 RepID=UPI0024054531|nr:MULTISPECIES: membrane protein insertase YidC [unclassified Nocardioides]MDF9717991.1 membrane protein insertase YidC [Nocardioides sp. ChNu-99]MDN7123243.1 membrane protein insertase YidC [Nocardioides sp. ChNu-153]
MFDFFGAIGGAIMTPLYYAVSAVMLAWHELFSLFLPSDSGATWILSIVGLTLVIRAALIPLFVKQIKSSRNMALLQPQVRELQKKYKHDRERLAQETMQLYKEAGTNPFASCLPILLQMPIFFALFRLLDQAARNGTAHGFLTTELARNFGDSELFGIPIARTFIDNDGNLGVSVLAAILVIAMTITTFTTQRQLMSKNMPPEALTGPYAQQQKMLLYILPLVFAIGGVAFPIGVLFYWTTSNLWTMGQQFYVIRRNPAPGTPAAKAKAERDAEKARRKGHSPADGVSLEKGGSTAVETAPETAPRPRQQPQRQTKAQRSKASPAGSKPRPQGSKSAPTKKKR